ncbi:phosphoribosylanthranilate isomerase [Parabacteroides sp. PF5-6]|uniref:phosphoribosylanthranilate isomerase n=1 Tax=Parabacteroides sp. PF5-6 TaxID=1742403 RepID=UPI002406E769|nr:phosphoribosylanthranilate isomerase [Parabacteroides sp. PF5-6]MDF9828976.1 phosphoribosylanthranilate isomerase [Parabacteroides sp. PF5-6]
MIIKVCGMRDTQNIQEVAALGVDWIGLIFYPKSPRAIENEECRMKNEELNMKNSSFKKVGVFVNATFEEMMEAVAVYGLDYLQLHGDESPERCFSLQKRGISLIKAISIATIEDLEKTKTYEEYVDYFLFDTKCKHYGGSGKTFDWSILSAYKGNTPFLLSGGIHPGSVEAIRNVSHPQCAGIDLNSGFETEPALKDIEKLKFFLSQLSNNVRLAKRKAINN